MADLERRFVPATEVRVSEIEGQPSRIAGVAAVFNSRSVDLGGFFEVIAPGAFTDVLKTNPDVRAVIDHKGGLQVFGRTSNGTLALRESDTGLEYEATPPDTQAVRDLKTLIAGKYIKGSSFSFMVAPGGDSWVEQKDGSILRTVSKIAWLGDVCPTDNPAYLDTSVAIRSLSEWRDAQKPKSTGEAERMKMRLQLAERA
jgi:hypothetical protein